MPQIVVNTQSAFEPWVDPMSYTTLEGGGGYVGRPTTAPGDGYVGIQTVNAPNIGVVDQFVFWVKENPIMAMLGAVVLVGALKRGRR